MKITVRLKGPLSKYAAGATVVEVKLEDASSTVRTVLDHFGIPASSVSFAQVNSLKSDLDHSIKGGDTVTFNPRVAGG